MKVKCVKLFYDLEAKEDRKVGDVFEVSAERLKALEASEYAPLVEKVPAKKAAPKKAAPKKAAEPVEEGSK